jgi:heme exporter protein D
MNWGSWSEFWTMGGYGLYVWGSYFVTAALLAVEVALVMARKNSITRLLSRMPRGQYGRIKDETET